LGPEGRRGHGQLRRAGGAAGRASGRAQPEAHLGAVSGRSGGGRTAGGGSRWRLVATAAAAQGNPARRRNAGLLVSTRATLEPRGTTGVVDWRRERADARARGGGGNGGGWLGRAREGTRGGA
jgi:hypothetical protein